MTVSGACYIFKKARGTKKRDGWQTRQRNNSNLFSFSGEKLEEFLRSLNSSKPLYLGQTGLGNIEELGKLGLEPGENFCMGGPGMIFSREVLRRMVPHIGECLREMYTTHEDVEVGRCVRRFGGTQCVWSYEVSDGVNCNVLFVYRVLHLAISVAVYTISFHHDYVLTHASECKQQTVMKKERKTFMACCCKHVYFYLCLSIFIGDNYCSHVVSIAML